MKVAKIKGTGGGEYVTNVTDEVSLARLENVESIEIVEMASEEFWRTLATEDARRFFSPLGGAVDDVR
jgi:hypothetical protein